MSRLHKTLADYLVIAVSPALIMVLIGSLVFFLVDIFYAGGHQVRLEFVLGCFIFAAVLIGRIAIEMGKEHAMMYAAPLALVTAIAMNRFIEVSLFINVGLIALIWYCANKLTWDCTMVDENQDASGEGLLQRLGLERGRQGKEEQGRSGAGEKGRKGEEEKTIGSSAVSPSSPPPAPRPPSPTTLDGVTGGDDRPRPWWERLMKPPPRAHSPGASVVWFSLGALVLFGVGQFFIPASDPARRRHAFTMIVLFVASALGLLLTTSFLGLRRYLRQRQLQMPATMAGLWIAIGCSLIAAVLAFAVLLPRPNPEYAISQVPWKTTSPERGSSRYAVGKDAAEKDDGKSGEGESGQGKGAGDGGRGTGKSQGKGKGQQGDESKGDSKQSDQEGQKGRGKEAADRGRETGDGTRGAGKTDQKGKPASGGSQSGDGRRGTRDRGSKGQSRGQTPPASRPPSPAPLIPPSGGFEWLASLLQWVIYGVVIAAAAYWLWRSRHQLPEMLRRFLEGWRGFWSWLFGGRRRKQPAAAADDQRQPSAPQSRRFADYVDPFAAGSADRYPPDELVRYSFEALEAWARDNGMAREPEQTPYEFSQKIGARVESLAGDLRTLSGLYYRAAYARGSLSAAGVRPLEKLWRALRAEEERTKIR